MIDTKNKIDGIPIGTLVRCSVQSTEKAFSNISVFVLVGKDPQSGEYIVKGESDALYQYEFIYVMPVKVKYLKSYEDTMMELVDRCYEADIDGDFYHPSQDFLFYSWLWFFCGKPISAMDASSIVLNDIPDWLTEMREEEKK